MDWIGHDAILQLIGAFLQAGYRPRRIVVDTVGTPRQLHDKIMAVFPEIPSGVLLVEPKADTNHPVVSAASILAKTQRDRRMLTSTTMHENELMADSMFEHPRTGTGYPSDSATREWLQEHSNALFGPPRFARHTWKTAQNLGYGPPEETPQIDMNSTDRHVSRDPYHRAQFYA
jgi:ribonuclease HII